MAWMSSAEGMTPASLSSVALIRTITRIALHTFCMWAGTAYRYEERGIPDRLTRQSGSSDYAGKVAMRSRASVR